MKVETKIIGAYNYKINEWDALEEMTVPYEWLIYKLAIVCVRYSSRFCQPDEASWVGPAPFW